MKTIKQIKSIYSGLQIVTLLFAMLVIMTVENAKAGKETGNGGEEVEREFINAASSAAQLVEGRMQEFPEVSVSTLYAAINGKNHASVYVKVIATDETVLGHDGYPKIAINLPLQKRIKVNISKWRQLGNDKQAKMSLALHEYFGILGIERGHYQVSSRLFGTDIVELSKGRFGKIKHKQTYHMNGGDLNSKTLYTEVDYANLKIYLTTENGKNTLVAQCPTVDAQKCSVIEGMTSLYDGWKDEDGYPYNCPDSIYNQSLRLLEDGSFMLTSHERMYSSHWYSDEACSGTRKYENEDSPSKGKIVSGIYQIIDKKNRFALIRNGSTYETTNYTHEVHIEVDTTQLKIFLTDDYGNTSIAQCETSEAQECVITGDKRLRFPPPQGYCSKVANQKLSLLEDRSFVITSVEILYDSYGNGGCGRNPISDPIWTYVKKFVPKK